MNFTPSRDSKYNTQTDTALWAKLCAGEKTALSQIYERHSSLVYGISLKLLSNAQEAEDLAHDVFIELVEKKTYDPARGALRTFLLMLTRSRATDRLRSRQISKRHKQTLKAERFNLNRAKADATVETVLAGERTQTVDAAFNQLSELQRRALHLAYYEGLSQADIAARLEVPVGTIKSRTRRGLLKLREILSMRQEATIPVEHARGGRE